MRIQSKFKDYYDFPQKWGFDPKVVYERNTVIQGSWSLCNSGLLQSELSEWRPEISCAVGIAGDLFFFKVEGTPKDFEIYQIEKPTHSQRAFHSYFDLRRAEKEALFAIQVKELFDQAPVWVAKLTRNGLIFAPTVSGSILNPSLSRLGLAFLQPDGHQVYQRIAQFICERRPAPDVPVPPDKDMVGIKGFDKFSFRKDKKV